MDVRRLAALVVVAALVAACGGGGGAATGGDGGAAPGGGGGPTLTVSGREFAPAALRAPANTTVTVEFTNAGTLTHDFRVDEADLRIEVQPGQTGTGQFTLPPGTYAFYCSLPGHRESGMEGTLTVS